MEVSADMYIVISLMFAVFSAVAAVGTSIVLGAGYERLRAGFEVVRKQTGFFADAIHKLDERTKVMNAQNGELKSFVSELSQKVDRVDAQSGFFVDSLQTLERKIEDLPKTLASTDQTSQDDEILMPYEMGFMISDDLDAPAEEAFAEIHFENQEAEHVASDKPASLKDVNVQSINPVPANQDSAQPGLSKLLASYFRGGSTQPRSVVYH